MKCKDCKYFVRINQHGGGCHARPPVPVYIPTQPDTVSCYWPWVTDDDWCGEFKMKVILN